MAMTSQEKTMMTKFPSSSGPKHTPWHLANKNKFISQVDMFDCVRGLCFIVTVYTSLNKKGEVVEDIIRVKHLGEPTMAIFVEYLEEKKMDIYPRPLGPVNPESLEKVIQLLKGYL
jgi:hypothetical protein